MAFNRRLSFIAEWHQEEAGIIRTFSICFYLADNAIEVYDQRSKKVFLRRTKMPDISESDLFVGSKINIFGRQFDIVDYGDEITKHNLAKHRKKTFILLDHSVISQLGVALCALIDSNFTINRGRMVQFTPGKVKGFLNERNQGNVEASLLMKQLLSGPSIGFELIAENAMEKIKLCQSQSKECYSNNIPGPLIALFEREEFRNGIHCSQSDEDVTRDLAFFFDTNNGLQHTCVWKNSTLGIIKPHSIKEGNAGKIISEITSNGFEIKALRMHLLERINSEEFLEVYKGILPEYNPMVAQLASGVSMALEIVCSDPTKNSHQQFREFCGPMDPEIAKLLRPHTLRAKFGVSKPLNAVHCTDLPDDAVLELEYLFQVLD